MEFDEFEPWRKRMKQAFDARPEIDNGKFSTELGKSRDYVNRMIKLGTANPSPTLLSAICEKLGVSAAFIIDGEDASEERDRVVRRLLDADAATVRRVSRALDLFEEGQ